MRPPGDAMLYADLRDPDLGGKLAALTPVPGYCICVDIVGSTGLKGAGLETWVTATLEAPVFAAASTPSSRRSRVSGTP